MSNSVKVPRVEVIDIRPINNGNLKGFATIKIGPLTMHDFRIIQQPEHRAYVSAPQVEYYDATGRKKYKPLMQYPEIWKRAISDAVLNEWDAQHGIPQGTRSWEQAA